ncbi:MAG TPA: 4Fe-4S dicluster domain-containing protein [Ramlibacter sp.]|uniref:4Fe-4S dicluster domain-containing protein n=1 Tax=Ramlibacter sp. TaxID=1917967 RepID=UPI002BD348C7|nr:4Fe-4S dicluster domain-containing protein [Ramlibacter sp.]HVZ46326.1 4Fe-4S dicluster domain-containing protein [Ramlibacter sp.]
MTSHEHPVAFHRGLTGTVNRRRAMALMAASLALANSACSRPPRDTVHPWVDMPEAGASGEPIYYASAFVRDGHAMGVLVGTRDGRPIKIEGNPAHPSSLGATDAFAQASVLQLWDPDRSAAVMQRGRDGAASTASWAAFETAWRAERARLDARHGEGLAILTGPVGSPTLRSQLAGLLQRFPSARWYQHAPLHDRAAELGAMAAFGEPVQGVLHLDRARCIVALASDPFTEGAGAVRHAADWARQRAAGNAAEVFAVEVTPGLFGARADHRIALPPAQIDAMVMRMAAALGGSPGAPADNASIRDFEARMVAALRASGPKSLLVPGACLAASSHARVHALHQRLGAGGHTLEWIAPLTMAAQAHPLAELVQAIDADAVDTLVILDANPAYDASPGFAARLAKVRLTVHAGLYRDETAAACRWHLPLSHIYEQWSDAPAHDGTATLVQPAIAPLYDTRSPHELVALLAADDVRDGMRIVQRQWRPHAGASFDAFWRESLREGVVAGTAATQLALRVVDASAIAPLAHASPPEGALPAVFIADPSVHDGRFGNSGWLQELPRPFTKLTWDNALFMGPATARSLGVATGQRVRASAGEHHADAPVWVLAGHAEGVVTLPLGYGRTNAGRVGNGVGFDAYPLRADNGIDTFVRLQLLPGTYDFAVTQHAMDQHGRELARTVAPGESAEHDHAPRPSLYPKQPPAEHAWAMTIDLDACIGCNACTIACQAENNIPVVGREQVALGREMHWIRVDRYDAPDPAGSIFLPVPCMHCENAPCELVCPVGATMHDSEGLNVQVYNRCVGTRFCSNNCPYKVRRFNFLQFSDETTETLEGQRNPEVTVRERGVMEKCTYCLQRIARARQHSQATGAPLKDGDVITACQAVCPAGAIHFGDLADPAAAIVRLRRLPRHYELLGELNTRPRTTYLARTRGAPRDEA